jgi:ABC-type bacteriocin/lantibiotic exporter with double-glycine peptidase domain
MQAWQKLAAWLLLAASGWAHSGTVILDVPFVAQPEDGCGAAVIVMLMQYWQREQPGAPAAPDIDELRPLISAKAGGMLASDLSGYLQRRGYRTFAVRGERRDLDEQLRHGRPLVVALKARGGPLHYVLVTGLDPGEDAVLKNDPAVRKSVKQHTREFLEQWKRAGNWMLLAVPS